MPHGKRSQASPGVGGAPGHLQGLESGDQLRPLRTGYMTEVWLLTLPGLMGMRFPHFLGCCKVWGPLGLQEW